MDNCPCPVQDCFPCVYPGAPLRFPGTTMLTAVRASREQPLRLGLARVSGTSMAPTLQAGDTLLVLHAGRPRVGSVVVVALPANHQGSPRPVAVKRLVAVRPDGALWVLSDGIGTDSRQLGHLAPDALLAVALLRLPRLRPLRRPRLLTRTGRQCLRRALVNPGQTSRTC